MSIRTILVDDHKLFRKGLCALLKGHGRLHVIAEADNGRQAVELADKHLPRLMIVDPSMPGLNGIDAAARIKRDHPAVKIIALSMHSDRRFVSSMLEAGASAYLLKTCDEDELFRAIDLVLDNKTYLSPDVAATVVDAMVHPPHPGEPAVPTALSSREREILQLLAEGKSAKQIASRLHVSSRTVDSHRQHIMSKVGLYTVAELTKFAIKTGLTSL